MHSHVVMHSHLVLASVFFSRFCCGGYAFRKMLFFLLVLSSVFLEPRISSTVCHFIFFVLDALLSLQTKDNRFLGFRHKINQQKNHLLPDSTFATPKKKNVQSDRFSCFYDSQHTKIVVHVQVPINN